MFEIDFATGYEYNLRYLIHSLALQESCLLAASHLYHWLYFGPLYQEVSIFDSAFLVQVMLSEIDTYAVYMYT